MSIAQLTPWFYHREWLFKNTKVLYVHFKDDLSVIFNSQGIKLLFSFSFYSMWILRPCLSNTTLMSMLKTAGVLHRYMKLHRKGGRSCVLCWSVISLSVPPLPPYACVCLYQWLSQYFQLRALWARKKFICWSEILSI